MKNEEPFLLYLEKKKLGQTKADPQDPSRRRARTAVREINVKLIKRYIKHLFSTYNPEKFLPDSFSKNNLNNNFPEPELNLFLWCILSNRIEIAKIFWRLGNV